MAADQRKRRLSASTAFGYGSQEQYRAKKRGWRLGHHDLNFNTHISLKWDENGQKVIAKEEQIGISWRDLRSFVPSAPCSNTKLADVLTIPRDVFQLNDLTDILSYEVWESLLSERERNHLMQFLPRGLDPDQAVQALLAGDNFHFGNPFLKWGASLCSGNLHPDAIIHHERSCKTNKKAYYGEVQQYHDNMIRNLQKLKERCASSKNPEAEIIQMMSRSKRHAEKKISSDANGFRSRKPEENAAAMSESVSSIADDKLYYSDNQKLSTIMDAEIQKRMRSQDLIKDKHEKIGASSNGPKVLPRSKKVEKLQKAIINSNDGAKYMCYVKISKKQHELVKSMKQSGTSIQSKSLNHVLGNLDSFNVKPYEMFVEEEQKRIHEHWSNLANIDLPAALENWRNGQSERRKIMSSLWQEMEGKLRFLTKDEKLVNPLDEEAPDLQVMDGESSESTSEHHQDDDSASQGSMSDKESNQASMENQPLNVNEEYDPSSIDDQSCIQNPPLNVNEEYDPSSIDDQSCIQNPPLNVNEELNPSSLENQSSMLNPALNVNEEFNPMDLNAENNHDAPETCDTRPTPKTFESSLSVSHTESHCSTSATNPEEVPCSSVKNPWSSINLPKSYCHNPLTTQYVSSSGPSLRHPQIVPDQPARLIDLESDLPEEDTTKDLLNRHTNHMPYFNPYPNRDRSELLHSLIKRDNYHQEPNKTGLEFHPTTNVLLEPSQFPNYFQDQLQPSFGLDHRQKVQSELFMNQNIQGSIYSDNTRYSLQGVQEHFSSLNMRDWSNPRISTPIQSSQLSSGELLNHGGWSGSDGPVFSNPSLGSSSGGPVFPNPSLGSSSGGPVFSNPSLGSSSGGDQSLYSVFSQCTNLLSRAPYNPVGSSDPIIPSVNYGQDMGGGIPMTSNSLPHTPSPLDYLSGNEATIGTLKNGANMGWMSMGHQTSKLQDPSRNPFSKSWNQ